MIRSIINPIIAWSELKKDAENAILELQKQLIELWRYVLASDPAFDKKNYPDPPSFDYQQIRNVVQMNFPKLGMYNIPSDISVKLQNTKIYTGDSIDDICDIIRDLKEVQWRLENTSNIDASWYLNLLFLQHSGHHVADLLWYLMHSSIEE